MSPAKRLKLCAIPRILNFNLALVDKFERNLALPATANSVQDKDVLLPQIIKEVFSHFREYVLSSGEDIGWRRTTFQVWNPTQGSWHHTTCSQTVRQCD